MYSKGIISTAFITNVTSVGEVKFDVVTNNRTFIFRAESEGVSVLVNHVIVGHMSCTHHMHLSLFKSLCCIFY